MTCHHHLRLGARLVSRAVLVPVPRLVIIPRAFVSKYSTTTTTTTITAGSCSIATGLIPPTKPHQCQRTAVNAPASTLPAPLSLPSRDDDPEMSKLTYYFRLGKAYVRPPPSPPYVPPPPQWKGGGRNTLSGSTDGE